MSDQSLSCSTLFEMNVKYYRLLLLVSLGIFNTAFHSCMAIVKEVFPFIALYRACYQERCDVNGTIYGCAGIWFTRDVCLGRNESLKNSEFDT